MPPVANGMATAADWMSAASFISMAGLISFMGYDGSVYLMGWTGGYVLLALLLAPYLRKFGQFTVPDFIGDRYDSQTARIVAVVCAIFVSFTYVAGQMRGVGIVFSRFLEVEVEHGVMIGMGVVFFYAVLGGMKGITYTQVAQFCVLIFAYLVPAIFLSLLMDRERDPSARVRRDGRVRRVPARQARFTARRARVCPVYQRSEVDDRCLRDHRGAHGRDRGTAARDRALLHRASRLRRPDLRRLGARLHRTALHDGSGGRGVRAGELARYGFRALGGRPAGVVRALEGNWTDRVRGQERRWQGAIRR